MEYLTFVSLALTSCGGFLCGYVTGRVRERVKQDQDVLARHQKRLRSLGE